MSRYILVVGPDGSGKSTLAAGLVSALEDAGRTVSWLHFDPRWPVSGETGASVKTPHGQRRRGYFASCIALLIRWCRYLGAHMDGSLSKGGREVVIQERGWLDQAVDPRRYRLLESTRPLARLLGLSLRRPDLVVLCGGRAAVISARCGELSEKETRRQLQHWNKILGRMPVLELDSTRDRIVDNVALAACAVEGLMSAQKCSREAVTVPFVPRRLEMTATRGAGSAIRLLYRPLTTKGVVAGRVAASVVRVSGHRRTVPPFEVRRLLASVGIADRDHAIIRSHGRMRFVIGTVDGGGTVTHIVKVAHASQAASLGHEASILERLSDSVPGVSVPDVISRGEMDGWCMLALRALPVRRIRPTVDLKEALRVAVALRWALRGNGVTHGDFAPWNLMSGTKPALVDWEHAQLLLRPGDDLLHYLKVSGLVDGDATWGDAHHDRSLGALLDDYCAATDFDRALLLEADKTNAHY